MASAAHKKEMAERRERQRNRETGFLPVRGKLSDTLVARHRLLHPDKPLPIRPEVRAFDLQRVKVAASINRHTGKPHEHRREIARRARQAASL